MESWQPPMTFVPWVDGALLPEESVYALMNKIAWLSLTSVVAYVRSCRARKHARSQVSPAKVDLATTAWSDYLEDTSLMPFIKGRSLKETIENLDVLMKSEVPRYWREPRLKICEECVRVGIHLRLHQHRAVLLCPIHRTQLRVACSFCGAALNLVVQSHVPAFGCAGCARELASQLRLETVHSNALRESAASSSTEFGVWQAGTNLMAGLGSGYEPAIESSDVSFLGTRNLILQAAHRVALAPDFVERSSDPSICVRMRCIDFDAPLAAAISDRPPPVRRPDPFDPSTCPQNVEDESQVVRTKIVENLRDRQLLALQRVTAMFLAQVRKGHANCLDDPYYLFGESLREEEDSDSILDCCPVAIGFWLWRLGSTEPSSDLEWKKFLMNSGRVSNLDLLLYGVSRSFLHYCIHAARSCVASSQNGGDANAATNVLKSLSWGGDNWVPAYREVPHYHRRIDIDGFGHYLSFGLRTALDSIPCPGRVGYVNALRRRLRNTYVGGRCPQIVDMEKGWESKVRKPKAPFALMSRDLIFLRDAPEQPSEKSPQRRMRVGNSLDGLAAWQVLESAIYAKSPLEILGRVGR